MRKTLIITAFALMAFKANDEKKLTVAYSVNDWQKKVDLIEITKNALKNSNLPVNAVLPLCDSLSKFESELVTQLQPQVKADTIKKK